EPKPSSSARVTSASGEAVPDSNDPCDRTRSGITTKLRTARLSACVVEEGVSRDDSPLPVFPRPEVELCLAARRAQPHVREHAGREVLRREDAQKQALTPELLIVGQLRLAASEAEAARVQGTLLEPADDEPVPRDASLRQAQPHDVDVEVADVAPPLG